MRIILLSLVFIMGFIASSNVYASSEKKSDNDDSSEYVKLDPLILPVIDDDGVYQTLSMVIIIEVDNIFDADKVKEKAPKLKDAYIQDMYGVLNRHAALKGGVVQVEILKERLNNVTREIMGDEIQTEVLLQVVQQRPI